MPDRGIYILQGLSRAIKEVTKQIYLYSKKSYLVTFHIIKSVLKPQFAL